MGAALVEGAELTLGKLLGSFDCVGSKTAVGLALMLGTLEILGDAL